MNWTPEDVAELDERNRRIREGLPLAALANRQTDPTLLRQIEEQTRLRTHNLTAAVKTSGRIRQPKGPNKTEKRYWQHLEAQKMASAMIWCAFEDITLRIGNDCRYTPDFSVWMMDGSIQFHEVKGRRKNGKAYYEDDARVKIAAAAKQYPMFKFLMVWPGKNGEWESKEF